MLLLILFIWVGVGGILGALVTPTVFKNMGLNPRTGLWAGLAFGAVGNVIGLFWLWSYVPKLNPHLEDPSPLSGFTPIEKQVGRIEIVEPPSFREKDPVKLRVGEISLSFGGIKALQSVEFDVMEGEILAVIGPNGAGKTSLINSINGFYRPQQGRIFFEGRDIT
ncbi:MAG: ATP-binding cassette domain-containing protein, partial [Chloroflexota bacterium]